MTQKQRAHDRGMLKSRTRPSFGVTSVVTTGRKRNPNSIGRIVNPLDLVDPVI
jgi:hypothetical protein